MKKVLLISLFSLFLFGCVEKKVTEEMLIGYWECTSIGQYAKWKNGVFQDYGDAIKQNKSTTYKIYNGILMKGRGTDITNGEWQSVSANIAVQDLKNLKISNNIILYTTSKLEYISDREYKQSGIIEYIYPDLSEDEQMDRNSKFRFEESCFKIGQGN